MECISIVETSSVATDKPLLQALLLQCIFGIVAYIECLQRVNLMLPINAMKNEQ